MRIHLLPREGTFYKANLHIHSTDSDGRMTPQEVKAEYQKRGYSIVAYTDHEILKPHNELADGTFLPITATEVGVSLPAPEGGYTYERCYHLNLFAKDKDKSVCPVFNINYVWPPEQRAQLSEAQRAVCFPRTYTVEEVNRLIAKANEEGFFVSLNHPNWSLQSYEDYAGLKGLWGVEWYNTGCVRAGYPDTMQPLDDLLRLGRPVIPLATDDAHAGAANPHDCFGGWCMIKAARLDYDTVIQAMLRGDLYSSSGPAIEELYLEDGFLHIKCSPVATVEVMTERRVRFRRAAAGITEAVFDLRDYLTTSRAVKQRVWDPYFRITLTDAAGEQAHSRAYFEKDWEG